MTKRLGAALTVMVVALSLLGSEPASARPPSTREGAGETVHWHATRVAPRVARAGTALDCATPSACTVVDGAGQALRFDGDGWRTPTAADGGRGSLSGVSCPTNTMCAAVGGPRLAWRTTSGWHSRAVRANLATVSCPTGRFCLAVGDSGVTFEYVDGHWRAARRLALDHPVYVASNVSCVARDFCVVVDSDGLAHRFRGDRWGALGRVKPTHAGEFAGSLECESRTFCMASDQRKEAQWNGKRWVKTTLPREFVGGWWSLSCSSSRFCALVSNAGDTVTWDGSWHVQARQES